MSSTIASIAIFFFFSSLSNFLSFFLSSSFFFYFHSPPFHPRVLSTLFLSPRCCFRSRIFRQQGLVLFRRRATLIVNSTAYQFFFFFSPLSHTRPMMDFHDPWKMKMHFSCVLYICDKRDTRFRFGETMGQGRGQRTFCYCSQLDFLLAARFNLFTTRRDFFFILI